MRGEDPWIRTFASSLSVARKSPFGMGRRLLFADDEVTLTSEGTTMNQTADTNLRNSSFIRGATNEFTVDFGFARRQREVDVARGERALGHFILPPFQRPSVWTQEQQIRWIESMWSRMPLPAYVFNQSDELNSPTDEWLIDGQQRWSAVFEYVDGRFPVMGYYWDEVSEVDRRFFMNRPWTCIRTAYTDESVLRDIYDRLAYGGTPHDPSDREVLGSGPSTR